MNAKSLTLALALIIIGQVAKAQNFDWAKQMGGAISDPGQSSGQSIAVDPSGNVYTTGYFQGEVDFDPGVGTFDLSSAGLEDIFISKLDASGNFVWAKRVGGTGSDLGYAIAVDALGNVYLTGSFQDIVDFDPGASTFTLSSAGSDDVFILKLDPSGNFVWAKRVGGKDSDIAFSIAVDGFGADNASSNVYTTGSFRGTVDFDPGASTSNFSSAGSGDIFISKLDASGNFVWAKQMGGTDFDRGHSIAVDPSLNVYTTGFFRGTVDFDPGTSVLNLSSSGSTDVFISKLDAAGNFVWAKQMGGTGSDRGQSIAVDASKNVYTTGLFTGTADFDPGIGTVNLNSTGIIDIFISKLDAAGNFVWAKQMGGTSLDAGESIAVDGSGNVYTTGSFRDIVDFDPGTSTANLSSASFLEDIFISKLDASGNFVWAKQMGGASPDVARAIAVDESGNVYTTGYFVGTADFDPGVGIFDLTSGGGADIFVHKIAQNITGLSEQFSDKDLIIYPNPTTGQISIALDKNVSRQEIVVRNYLGQEIMRNAYAATSIIELTIEGQAGLYLLEIINDDKKEIIRVIKR